MSALTLFFGAVLDFFGSNTQQGSYAMKATDDQAIRTAVRDHYASVVTRASRDVAELPPESEDGCCKPSCCGGVSQTSEKIGYSPEDLRSVPKGADLGLGCGNPQAIASLKTGEIVLDLGAGAGFDSFLAAREVGPSGKVIGVDMTPAMLEKARLNCAETGFGNVEFRLGEIEHLPVADASVDVVISNCVINLSPDKAAVFAETFRVLKPGGSIAISDVVAIKPLPEGLAQSVEAHACCISGAPELGSLKAMLVASGFSDISITVNDQSHAFIRDWLPDSGAEEYVASAIIRATKTK
jgi:arsenite methyltransferase